jgi:hypothetical protein
MQKCADYFKLDYRTISSNLDTMLATLKNEMLVYFFSNEISFEIKKELLVATKKASNVTTKI